MKTTLPLILCILLNNNAFAEANIIYAPTTTPKVIEATIDDNTAPISSEISEITLVEDTANIDVITVYNVYEENGNYYCNNSGGNKAVNSWRKISRESYEDLGGDTEGFNQDYVWYYFGNGGKAVKGSSNKIRKQKIGNDYYAFNPYGAMLLGYFNEEGNVWNENESDGLYDIVSDSYLYHSDINTGILTAGWLRMDTTLDRYEDKTSYWMYFMPSNFRGVKTTTNNYKAQKIDGKNYAFDDVGIMLTGFEPMRYNEEHGGQTSKTAYFGDDGAEITNGFVNVDLSNEEISEYYGDPDEDVVIYLNKSGKMYYNTIKKIGSYYYGFDNKGAIIKGLSVWNGNEYIDTIDTESTNGKSFIIDGNYVNKSGNKNNIGNYIVHYFGTDGKRKTSESKMEFADESYSYYASNTGGYNDINNKKFYKNGILLKPTNDCKYGIYLLNKTKSTYTFNEIYNSPNTYVISSNGTRSTSTNGLKDDNDNYWLLNSQGNFIGVYTVNVKESGGTFYYKSTPKNKSSEDWIPFNTRDAYGKTCRVGYGNGDYQVRISNDNCTNFFIK